MANGTSTAPGLTFPKATFAKLTPGPYLHAHLKQPNAVRPNGRSPEEFRTPVINTGSLTHSNGSAVVRCGDTAIVCGVRAEILLASDVPQPPSDDLEHEDLIETMGLLVPNVELSTGCSPAHLPGNPPTTLAQALSYRILSLLHTSNIVDAQDLRIMHTEQSKDEDLPDEGPREVCKAYWVLYIDILCISLDGNAFDTAWLAVMAALQDTALPKACWDQDSEVIMCSPAMADGQHLRLKDMPVASTFSLFSTASPLKQNEDAQSWVLADPDTLEEELAHEAVTVVVTAGTSNGSELLRIEKNGGTVVDPDIMASCIELAEARHGLVINLFSKKCRIPSE